MTKKKKIRCPNHFYDRCMRKERQTKKRRISAAKAQKSEKLLKISDLMTIRPTSMMVKQYTGSKCCLRIRSTRRTW